MRRAFVMGSNGPKHANPLRYAVRDAQNIKACFEGNRCGFIVQMPETNSHAWKVREQLSAIAGKCTPEDVFICYFSGHGKLEQGELFLLWDKTNLDNLYHTGIPISSIRESLKHCQAHSKLLILDCCHAGASVDKWLKDASTRPSVEDVIAKPENHLAFLASSRIEQTRELDELKGSFFTHFIVEGITNRASEVDRDRDGLISIDDLNTWVEERTTEHNRKTPTHRVPLPYLYGQRRGGFYLTIGDQITWPWPHFTGVEEAHKAGIKGDGVLVLVLDTGCDAGHQQFRHTSIDFRYIDDDGSAIDRCGFDTEGLGTHNCGIIGGKDIGIAPNVKLCVASALDNRGELARILGGFDWLISVLKKWGTRKPAVVLMPFGIIVNQSNPNDSKHIILRHALSIVSNYNVLCIASIGNEGKHGLRAPACFPEVLAAGAVNRRRQRASFSSFGKSPVTGEPKPDIMGLGVNVFSSRPRNSANENLYERLSGTSSAAAYVAGIAALYFSGNKLKASSVREKILKSALKLPASGEKVGAGLARFVC